MFAPRSNTALPSRPGDDRKKITRRNSLRANDESVPEEKVKEGKFGRFRGMVRQASFHLSLHTPRSSSLRDLRQDSCESLYLDFFEQERNSQDNLNNSSRRPLRQLCRAASSRLFASFHTTKSTSTSATELVDSYTSFNSMEDDDSSVCSFEDDDGDCSVKEKRVSFARKPVVHPVENCYYMSPLQRADCWYTRQELFDIKRESRMSQLVVQKNSPDFMDALMDGFMRAQMLADAGFEDEDILEYDFLGQKTTLSDVMVRLCRETVNGEACRGLEKGILRRLRASEARLTRDFVLATENCNDVVEIAREYSAFSKYAAIFAASIAQADTIAASEE